MKRGWILLHRQIYSSTSFRNELDRSIFIFLLSQASYEPVTVIYRKKRIALNRGELLITYGDIAKKFGITVQNSRTVIKNLKLTGTLTVSLTRGLMRISIEKYIQYQDVVKKKTDTSTGTLTNRRKKLNKSNKSNIVETPMINKYKKIEIPKSSKPRLKNLRTEIFEEKVYSEFEIARKRLSSDRFEEFVKQRLATDNKSN